MYILLQSLTLITFQLLVSFMGLAVHLQTCCKSHPHVYCLQKLLLNALINVAGFDHNMHMHTNTSTVM